MADENLHNLVLNCNEEAVNWDPGLVFSPHPVPGTARHLFNTSRLKCFEIPCHNAYNASSLPSPFVKIVTVTNEVVPAGSYTVPFDGNALSSGIYIYRLRQERSLKAGKWAC